MSTKPAKENRQLPERPNLEWLKKRARSLAKERAVKLSKAQFQLARTYGFASWPKLKAYVEMVNALTRVPDEAPDEFLSLVCLTYGDDHPSRVERSIAMAPTEPSDVWTAAAMGQVRHVDDASAMGGPFEWEPLLYLCYSRFPMSESDATTTATVLLDAGADPNAKYFWHGNSPAFTALTGVLGGGEGSQPPHPHWQALAQLLLERGADPNDEQLLYNRQFHSNNDHLELLFEFGLGERDGFPMVHHQLRWAIHHNMIERVRLMADHGVDLTRPFDGIPTWATQAAGKTPIEFAALCGHDDIVAQLAKRGIERPRLDLVDEFIATILAGRHTIARDIHPDVPRTAQERRPSLVVQAAATGRRNAVMAAVANGFDVNALGRADAPAEEPWQTALHTAVERNDQEMIDLLLKLGADPSIEDARFHATPAGWAEHFGYELRL